MLWVLMQQRGCLDCIEGETQCTMRSEYADMIGLGRSRRCQVQLEIVSIPVHCNVVKAGFAGHC